MPWLAAPPLHTLQQALRDLDAAYANFFARRASFPRFKRKGRDRDSFRLVDREDVRVEEGRFLVLAKIGRVRARFSRPVEGRLLSATIARDGEHWFASLTVEQEIADPTPPPGAPVGIDMGVTNAMTLSTGEVIQLPRTLLRDRRRIARLQRKVSRAQRGSANRRKAAGRLGRAQRRLARRRHDALHKATTRLAKDHALIALEDLRVTDMTRSARGTTEKPGRRVRQKAGLNRAIQERLWAEARREFEYKARWYGSTTVAVPPAGTSITGADPACGHTDPRNRESQAVFRCVVCGYTDHADTNAAKNILARADAILAGRSVVEPDLAAGHAERRNACGGSRSQAPDEAGTTRPATRAARGAPA